MVEEWHSIRTSRMRSSLPHNPNGPLLHGRVARRKRWFLLSACMPLFILLQATSATTLFTHAAQVKQHTGLECDFEKNCEWWWPPMEENFVSFRLATGVEITKMQMKPPFYITGPHFDFEGNRYGHFLYLWLWQNQTSNSNNLIQITSPWYEHSGIYWQLEFDLHTKSYSELNQMKVIIDYNTSHPIYVQMMENKDSKYISEWRHMKITIGMINRKFRLIMKMELPCTIRPYHVAIDNIKLLDRGVDNEPDECSGFRCQNTMCIPKDMLCDLHRDCLHGEDENDCDGYPEGARCNFESGMCGWKNINTDEMDWEHYQGSVRSCSSKNSQHPDDHTLGNGTGYYMLSLIANGNLSDTAILESPVFNPPPCYHRNQASIFYESCMIRLFYHKEGRNQGSLRLEIIEHDGSRSGLRKLLIQMTGDQGDQWNRLIRPVPATVVHPYQIHVMNIRAMRDHGYMGLDDISLSPECFGLGVTDEALSKCQIETTTEVMPTSSEETTTEVMPTISEETSTEAMPIINVESIPFIASFALNIIFIAVIIVMVVYLRKLKSIIKETLCVSPLASKQNLYVGEKDG